MSVTYTAYYWRYRTQYSEVFESAEEAAQFLLNGEEDEFLSWEKIVSSEGAVLADHKVESNSGVEIYKHLYDLGAKDGGCR